MGSKAVTLTALSGMPLIEAGDDLATVIATALERQQIVPQDGDILVIAQKIVSKAEGRVRALDEVSPSRQAMELARAVEKDPRHVHAILEESREVVRHRQGVLITEHRLGFVMANAGIDQSNVAQPDGRELILLLPLDPDASCAALKASLDQTFEADLGIIINDSFGRPWRNGVVGVALGVAGLPSLVDLAGEPDLYDRPMRVTQVALADEVAAAASMLMGQAAEGLPVVHVRGVEWSAPPLPASALVRPKHRDMFR